MLKLSRPLFVTDTETTGTHPRVDRICQIAYVKFYPSGERDSFKSYVNPGIPIPPEATEVHSITDEMVKDAPHFADLAGTLQKQMLEYEPHDGVTGGFCDFGGFAIEFDLKMYDAEFRRLGFSVPLPVGAWLDTSLPLGKMVDAQDIYRRYHPRTLSDAVELYLGRKLTGAHDAWVDTEATADLIYAMLEKHSDLPQTVPELHAEFKEKVDPRYVDPDGKLYWRYGEAHLNFSDKAGTPLRQVDRGFMRWCLDKDFPEPFKKILRAAMLGTFPTKNTTAEIAF